MPFLIDSVTMELNRRGFGVHLIIHPVMTVRRDADDTLTEVLPPHPTFHGGELPESIIHAEVTRHTDPAELEAMRGHLLRVIGEVRAAVEDWPAMREQALEIAGELDAAKLPARRRRRSTKSKRSSPGSRTTTSRSSATATTTSSTTRAARRSRRSRARASASCAGPRTTAPAPSTSFRRAPARARSTPRCST